MVTRLVSLFFLCCAAVAVRGAAYTSTGSGLFSAAATWGGGGYPNTSGDTFTVSAGHTVWYDVDNSLHADGYGASVVTGILAVTNTAAQKWMKMNGALSGAGDFWVGTASDPITNTAVYLPGFVLEFKAGNITMTKGGGQLWYGQTNHFVGYITNTVSITGDSTNLYFADTVSGVTSNDLVYVDNHNVRGQAGSVHLVWSVETNRITLFTSPTQFPVAATNHAPGLNIIGALTTNNRTNGTQVTKLSRPVVVFQPTKISSTGVWSASGTNTLRGVRCTNLGRAPIATLNAYTIVSCVGNNNTAGGIAYYGTGHTVIQCVGNNNSNGGIANYGTGHTITQCVGNNNSNGGIANYGTGYTITQCVGNNNLSGGIAFSGAGHTITQCVGNNNSSGGIAYYGAGHTITQCVGNNNSNGGIANYGAGHTITQCVGNNNSNGGIANNGAQVLVNCVATNQAAPTLCHYPAVTTIVDDTNGLSFATLVTTATLNRSPYDVIQFNRTNWHADFGAVTYTNQANPSTSVSAAHWPNTVGKPIPMYVDYNVRPSSVRMITLWLYGKANVGYAYQATSLGEQPLAPVPAGTTAGWTASSVSVTNALDTPIAKRLWVISWSTNSLSDVGLSWVDLGKDEIVRVQ